MQRFNFRLETLLKYRKLQVDQAQAEFGRSVAVWQSELQKLELFIEENARMEDGFRKIQQTRVTADELQRYCNYRQGLKIIIALQEEHVRIADDKRNDCRDRLAAAMQRQKLVEKIKEKKYAHYCEELLKEEQKELDEIGLQLYIKGD